ncbi:hypothetical protein F8M41_023819 [Gigaspora margarita]|uniref:Uncharacterized protein n=1 Tax=Gigaspora margarita TaxID=4874 RepID=A0A8H4ACP1_GIGMA|nr:hypothetical protein F8M41_023819 [Gigaspora margarita]
MRVQQQFYSNADIDRLVEEPIAYRKKTKSEAKTTKKPGSSKEKADKIHIDHFLDDLAKDNSDHNSSSFHNLHINQTKIAKDIKKISSKPKSSHCKTKSKSKTNKKQSSSRSKQVNAHIISDESSSNSSNSKNNNTSSSENKLESNTLAIHGVRNLLNHLKLIHLLVYNLKKQGMKKSSGMRLLWYLQPISDLIRIASQQSNTLSQNIQEEQQPEAEIL